MRAVKTRQFYIKHKVMPFARLPELVHEYFEEQGLKPHRFMYYFCEILYAAKPDPVSCLKVLKDIPCLGDIRILDGEVTGYSNCAVLTNVDADNELTDETIMPYMGKLQRYYGLGSMDMYWYDADFFGEIIKLGHDTSWLSEFRKQNNVEPDPLFYMNNHIYGSGVRIHKSKLESESVLFIDVEMFRNGETVDVEQYLSAMSDKLPGVKYDDSIKYIFTDDEKGEIERMLSTAEPLIEKAKARFLSYGFEPDRKQIVRQASYTLAPKLKKLSKIYGFMHRCEMSGFHEMQKTTANGHRLIVNVDCGPSHFNSFFYCTLAGMGFRVNLCNANFLPLDQKQFDACADRFFEALGRFEQTDEFRKADGAFPPAPDWFIE